MLNTDSMENTDIVSNNFNISAPKYDSWENHLGAFFLQDGRIVFKLFTYLDVLSVKLEIKCIKSPIQTYNMDYLGNGIWEIILDKGIVNNGDRYRFVIEFENGEIIKVKDPCSMYQDAYFKWSRIYNHYLFNWRDDNWTNNLDKRKVSRLSGKVNKLSPVKALSIYELHIGTFTQEGTFKAAKDKLKIIAEDLKFNAIEIMPVENTYSFNWGYDGVDKYAPNHTYGHPDDLKELINEAHILGLNVIMDIVPNHLGPDIAELNKTGPYIEGDNCFGFKFNFEGENSDSVRDYITGAALNWLVNYHCDGLRVDMTKFMCSDYTMKQMVAEVNYYSPDAFLIAEDGRDNDPRIIKPFLKEEIEKNINKHSDFINKIKKNKVSLSNLGFDTEWDFLFHKQIASSVLGSWDCRIKNLNNFDYTLRDAQDRVKYIMSHDEIGNIDGTRLITKIVANELNLTRKMCDVTDCDVCKKAAHAAHKILVELVSGNLEKMSDEHRKEFYTSLSIDFDFPPEQVYYAYLNAIKMHKSVLGKVYSIPGPKMVFQGDESANLAYFKFFRKFSTGKEVYLREKGYEPGLKAFLDSKLCSVPVCDKYEKINQAVKDYMRDLNIICSENKALRTGSIDKTVVHELSDIHAIYANGKNNEIFSVSNFSKQSYYKNYGILFPKGTWQEILNSDDVKYAGSGKYHNSELINEKYNYISIPAYSIIFFKKID